MIQPGDLCMVVRNTIDDACVQKVIGTPVRVTGIALDDLCGFGRVWLVEHPVPCPGCIVCLIAFLEADLQRLRPPEQADESSNETPTQIVRELAPRPQVEFAR